MRKHGSICYHCYHEFRALLPSEIPWKIGPTLILTWRKQWSDADQSTDSGHGGWNGDTVQRSPVCRTCRHGNAVRGTWRTTSTTCRETSAQLVSTETVSPTKYTTGVNLTIAYLASSLEPHAPPIVGRFTEINHYVGLRSDTNIPCRDHLWPLPGLLIINIHFTQCYARYFPYFTCRWHAILQNGRPLLIAGGRQECFG